MNLNLKTIPPTERSRKILLEVDTHTISHPRAVRVYVGRDGMVSVTVDGINVLAIYKAEEVEVKACGGAE